MLSVEQENRLVSAGASPLLSAINFSQDRILKISKVIQDEIVSIQESLDLGYAISGSLGRLEAGPASDVDLVALCGPDLAPEQAKVVDQRVRSRIRAELDCDVSHGENFTGPTSLDGLVDQSHIGGSSDHVNLMTKRVTLLTETRPAHQNNIYEIFLNGILNAFNNSGPTRRRHLSSLTDEIVRYYRTLGIDYKSRVDFEGKSWSTRYLKLRNSRKYWFFSLALGMVNVLTQSDSLPERATILLPGMLRQSPTERILDALDAASIPNCLSAVAFYSNFLDRFGNRSTRDALAALSYGDRYGSPHFRELKDNTDRMHRAMLETINELPEQWRRHLIGRFLLQS